MAPDASPAFHGGGPIQSLSSRSCILKQPSADPDIAPLPTPRQSLDSPEPSIVRKVQMPTTSGLQITTNLPIRPQSLTPDNPQAAHAKAILTPPVSPDDLHPIPTQVNLPDLLAFLARKSGESTFEIKGIDEDGLKVLDDHARAGKLPGWDGGVRYVPSLVLIHHLAYTLHSRSFVDDSLILHYPTLIHEIIPDVFTRLSAQGKHLPSGVKPGSVLRNYGCADIPLLIGSKTPDFSIYERNELDVKTLRFQIHPTVVFEVGYSQKVRDLRHAAARLIGSSLGAVQLVVAIKLSYKNTPDKEREAIEKATAEFWELDRLQTFNEWTGAVNRVTEMRRSKHSDKTNSTNPRAVKYEYVLRENANTFTRVLVKCTQTHNVCNVPSPPFPELIPIVIVDST